MLQSLAITAGVGKSHVAQTLGHLAIRQGAEVRFAKTSRVLRQSPSRVTAAASRPWAATAPGGPTVRQVTGWITRRPDSLNDEEQLSFKHLRTRSRQLDATAAHVAGFADMITELHGEQLDDWIDAVEADDLPRLHSFTAGLRRDRAAVLNGLSMSHNSGMVEGTVNKIKFFKRQMYCHANLDPLRKRVLLGA